MLMAERPYFNDLEVPKTIDDVVSIEKSVKKALGRARAATVSIDLGDGYGSGVIISEKGLILTAAHVSGGVGKELTIIFEDGREVQAESLGLNSESDCAMMKLLDEDDEGKPWPFVELDRKESIRLGDWVFSLGYLGGFDEDRGVVLRVGRVTKIAPDTIRTDCQLLGGDSGGPLFDMTGRLVAIHSRIAPNLEGNMHVPMNEFQRHWEPMLAGEFIGEGPFAKRSDPLIESWEMKLIEKGGELIVADLKKGGVGHRAGFEKGDQLIEVNGEELSGLDNLRDMAKLWVEEKELVRVKVLRGANQMLTLKIEK